MTAGGHWRLPMRFYFDFLSHDNDEILDCEGVELVDWLAAHRYYADNPPDEQWPVTSVTKSVLSILVGIAIDKGLLRLDQRLPELIAEAIERPIDPRAADITLRDLLTMSSGFDPHEMVEGAGVRSSSVWMIRRTVRHTPGTHFYYDDEGTNLVAIILRRALGGNIGEFAKNELFGPGARLWRGQFPAQQSVRGCCVGPVARLDWGSCWDLDGKPIALIYQSLRAPDALAGQTTPQSAAKP